MNRHLAIGAACFALASLIGTYSDAWSQVPEDSMQRLTPPSEFVQTLNDERGNPDHEIWRYIAGVISGANVGALIASDTPLACGMHPITDSETTANLILRYLVETNQLHSEKAALEIAVVAAFSFTYPCGVSL